MRKAFSLLLACIVALLLPAVAVAQTVTITEETSGTIRKVVFDWTSDAGGDATAQTSAAFSGKVLALVTDPDATAPTTLYDITVTDEASIDVLNGAGADRSATATEQVTDPALLGVVANDKLTVTISNAGNAKKGKVFVYIR